MSLASHILISLVAVLHIFFLVLEMFLWTKPLGRKVFGLKQEHGGKSGAL